MAGLALDSSVSIQAERERLTVDGFFDRIWLVAAHQHVFLTAIGVTELVHGIYRADSLNRARNREIFLNSILAKLPVLDYTLDVARLVGQIDGEQTARGNLIPQIDLMIGGTALYYGCELLTANTKDFLKIPGLNVLAF